MGQLTATQVRAIKAPGRYHDGDGLILYVSGTGAASWILRAQAGGKRREFGLGSLKDIGLAEARDKASATRKQWRSGVDPVAARKKEEAAIPTFREAAARVHAERRAGWRNGKHQDQWLATMEAHVFPRIGDQLVSEVTGAAIREVLIEIWLAKPETARRVRQRIDAVLGWAVAKEYRSTLPAIKAIVASLPKQPPRDGHHAAMPYADLPAFMARLQATESWGRLALAATILTAARSGEVRGARWGEIDLEARTWTIPGARMKAGKPHKVPLSPAALAIFERAAELRHARSDLVFHGIRAGRPMSDMTLLKVLRDMQLPFTVHGFRSSFRDWAAEETAVPAEVAEAALAHAVPDKVEAAYKRTDFFEKRRALMDAWAAYLQETPADVIAFPGRKAREA